MVMSDMLICMIGPFTHERVCLRVCMAETEVGEEKWETESQLDAERHTCRFAKWILKV